MLKNILILTTAMLSLVSTAQAVEQVVVACRGSAFADMTGSETYHITLSDNGDLAVRPASKTSSGVLLSSETQQVLQNDGEALNIISARKRMGMVLARQTIEVDYRTGKGKAIDVQMMDVVKNKTIYLDWCNR